MAKRRTTAETHIREGIRGSVLDPTYGAESARTAGQERLGAALSAVLDTEPSLRTLDALDELLEALKQCVREVREGA